MVTPPPPDRSLGAVLVRAFLFCSAGYVAVYALGYTFAGVWRGGGAAPGGSLLGSAAIAAYVFLVTAVPAAFGFALVTSPWSAFRDLSPRAVAGISAAGGVVACLAQLTGLAAWLYWIPLPGFLGPIGAALRMLLPGMAVGVVALVALRAARLLRPISPGP
ncbi:MAG TPA: hypothetical protein VGO79_14420 [Thermoanaerobaculia bacterium]